jgi:undecaprenyl-diphosphatase
MWEAVVQLDKDAFLLVNGAHAPWMDTLMTLASDRFTWVPLYLFFFVLIGRTFGVSGLLWALPVLALMLFISDSGSVVFFKNTVQRLRPCHEPRLQGLVRAVDGCGGRYGFVSSHASNHAAIAFFLMGALGAQRRYLAVLMVFWVVLIGYGRVYLGVHYPLDVIVGAIYGAAVGFSAALLFIWSCSRPRS